MSQSECSLRDSIDTGLPADELERRARVDELLIRHARECEDVRASISAALDQELSGCESMRIRAHLAHCASCRAFQADAEAFVTALRTAPLVPLRREEETYELKLGFGELALISKSLQAAKTLGALPPQDELLDETIQVVDQALKKAV